MAIGFLPPACAAGFRAGESCGPRTLLRAVAPDREWTLAVEGPVWEVRWRVR